MSPSDILPIITKWPPRARITKVARLATKVIIGTRIEKYPRIASPISLALLFALTNLSYSCFCESRTRISAAPKILSLITLFSQSIIFWVSPNSFLTFPRIIKNVPPIIGTIVRTARPSCQLVISKSVLAPITRKMEAIIVPITCATNIFTASTSEVRLVNN